jgi:hypothetical protein
MSKGDFLQRARAWLATLELPRECTNENCKAVDKWKLGEVGTMNNYRYNKQERHGETDADAPTSYVVPVICEWCGRDYAHYDEALVTS